VAYEEGIFRVKLTAYGTTMDGRDFILDVPEYSFVAEGPAEPEIEDPLINGKDPIVDGSAPLITQPEVPEDDMQPNSVEDEMDDGTLTLILVAVNGSIVLIGVIAAAVIIIMRKKASAPKQANSTAKPSGETTDADLTMESEPKGFKKLLGLFKKREKAEKE
ncbi:MAG: TIGR03503 family protein, partial [Alteromonas macleodii]|nr:TIGR03503 family protein [Alteromonas macleodii]